MQYNIGFNLLMMFINFNSQGEIFAGNSGADSIMVYLAETWSVSKTGHDHFGLVSPPKQIDIGEVMSILGWRSKHSAG